MPRRRGPPARGPAAVAALAAAVAAAAAGALGLPGAHGMVVRQPPPAPGGGAAGGGSAALAPEAFTPRFFAPQLTPVQFLFISSPNERKVVYTELKNFRALSGRTFALVDSGLAEPCGLAFNHERGFLYVADRGADRIFRYRVLVQESSSLGETTRSLVTDGTQLCIVQNAPGVEWVDVDHNGDVFYSDTTRNTINRIPGDVIDSLAQGEYQCGDLRIVSAREQMQQAEAQAQADMSRNADETAALLPADPPTTQPIVLSLYDGNINPRVSSPAGVVSDSVRLYWANGAGGGENGTAAQGEVHPQLPFTRGGTGPVPFPATALTNMSGRAYGIAKSNTMVFYTTNTTGSGAVYGVLEGGGAHPFVSTLVRPRGLVWDGDNTIFVADAGSHNVYSFPVGRVVDDAPLTQSVVLSGAFGLALLRESDPAYQQNRASAARFQGQLGGPAAAAAFAAGALSLRA